MSTLLIDTSALHALNFARDDNHLQAVAYFKSQVGRVKPILTEWVFLETMNLTKARLGPTHAIAFGRQLKNSRAFYPLILNDEDKRATWDTFEKYNDKDWSYVDCSLDFEPARHGQQRAVDVAPIFVIVFFKDVPGCTFVLVIKN